MHTFTTLKPSYLISQWYLERQEGFTMKFSLGTKHQDKQNLVLPISSVDFYTQMLKINNVTIVQVVQYFITFVCWQHLLYFPKSQRHWLSLAGWKAQKDKEWQRWWSGDPPLSSVCWSSRIKCLQSWISISGTANLESLLSSAQAWRELVRLTFANLLSPPSHKCLGRGNGLKKCLLGFFFLI